MKKRTPLSIILAALICAVALLQGCSLLNRTGGPAEKTANAAAGTASRATQTAGETAAPQTAESPGTAAPGNAAAMDEFAAAFKTVDKNPLDENIQYVLWLAASNPQEASATPAASSGALRELADKYEALVADQGVHYMEVGDGMGFKIKTEYWVKGDKFKKSEIDLQQVSVYDGQSYIQYKTDEKTGTRFDPSYADAERNLITKGMLGSLTSASFTQKDDEKFGSFDCFVFFLDIEVLGMKGETLYVDKQTGKIVNMLMGEKGSDSSMSTYVESMEVGGFGDDVFAVPADITVSDYQPIS